MSSKLSIIMLFLLLSGFIYGLEHQRIDLIVEYAEKNETPVPIVISKLLLICVQQEYEVFLARKNLRLSKKEVKAKYGEPIKTNKIKSDPQIFGFTPTIFLKGDEEYFFSGSETKYCFRGEKCVGFELGSCFYSSDD